MLIPSNWNLDLSITFSDGNHYYQQLKLNDVLSGKGSVQVELLDKNGIVAPVQIWIQSLGYDSETVHVLEYTIRNPSPMDHPNGNWDLGAAGNLLIESCKLQFSHTSKLSFSDLNATAVETGDVVNANDSIVIHQASSGGEFWKSHNHIDRNGIVPLPFKGYRLVCDAQENSGNRITPILRATCENQTVGLTVKDFWQNFPIKLQANADHLSLELLSSTEDPPAELQGGEQKTFEIAIEFTEAKAASSLTDWIERADEPSQSTIDEVLKSIPYLTPRSELSDSRYEALVELAIEGKDTFFMKREVIDEYGWRHYGDVWGDHEAAYHRGETPMISHYNNQYDCTLGFAIQYLRTGDRRWWDLMIPMADHAWDVDTYHTDRDKLLYNGGLFWHTYHYADAHTATHRSYPKQLRMVDSFEDGKDLSSMGSTGEKLEKNYQVGGGPAASQNYSTGWMIAYYLTGKQRYKQAAINAADYVMRLENGNATPFKWLCRGETGYSTCSADGYYGPGRASANSTHALLTGHELTNDQKYLDRIAKLMRRTVHPNENLDRLDLLNSELRWFYTMYLQALCRYLDYKVNIGQRDADFRYGVASIIHYARWMSEHERPTLSRPDELQYPTETWAAQDMRKWQVLEHASRYEYDDKQRQKMRQKADGLYDYVVDYLNQSPTKSLCRPVILLLNFGWQRKWLLENRNDRLVTEEIRDDFGQPQRFTPQRTIAIRRFKKLAIASTIFGATTIATIGYLLLA